MKEKQREVLEVFLLKGCDIFVCLPLVLKQDVTSLQSSRSKEQVAKCLVNLSSNTKIAVAGCAVIHHILVRVQY